jgi:hypothetical protein
MWEIERAFAGLSVRSVYDADTVPVATLDAAETAARRPEAGKDVREPA